MPVKTQSYGETRGGGKETRVDHLINSFFFFLLFFLARFYSVTLTELPAVWGFSCCPALCQRRRSQRPQMKREALKGVGGGGDSLSVTLYFSSAVHMCIWNFQEGGIVL